MKGFKKDGKFRPTGNRKKSSLTKEEVKKHQFEDDRIGKTLPLTRRKESVEPKLDSRVEEYFDYGNSEEMTIWKVNEIDARPDFDGKVVPVEFFIQTGIRAGTGSDDQPIYDADLVMVPKKYGKKKWQEITDSVGSGNDKENEETVNMFDAISTGEYLDVRQTEGNSAEEAINELMENIQADAGLIGFVLDRQINGMGEDGWDRIAELALDRPFERRRS